MKTKQKKTIEIAKEAFRKVWWERFTASRGNIQIAADALGRFHQSLGNWGKPGAGLPNIYEATIIAKAIGSTPAEFAFGATAIESEHEAQLLQQIRAMTPDQLEAFGAMMKAFEIPPAVKKMLKHLPDDEIHIGAPQLHVTSDHDRGVTLLELKAREGDAPYGKVRKIENRKMRKNTRADYPVFHPIATPHHGRPRAVPMFMNLAAGPGRELEQCEDFHSFREYIPKQGIHAARVQGYSMMDTIRHGETILLQTFDDGKGVTLSTLSQGDPKTPFQNLQRHVKNQEIWVLAINGEEPTLKRVNIYDPHGDWSLTITADNPETDGFPRPIRGRDEVTFFAKLYGFVDTND